MPEYAKKETNARSRASRRTSAPSVSSLVAPLIDPPEESIAGLGVPKLLAAIAIVGWLVLRVRVVMNYVIASRHRVMQTD